MRVVITVVQEGDDCRVVLVEPGEGDLLLILQVLQRATTEVVNQLVKINAVAPEGPPA